MKKMLICAAALCMLMFTACEKSDDKSSDDVSSAGTSAESSVQSDPSEAEKSFVTVFFSNNKLHDGEKFDNAELVLKTSDFIGTVTKSYQQTNSSREELSKGAYLKIEQSGNEAHSLYIDQSGSNFVEIDNEVYETTCGEAAEFYEYVTGYLKNNGYME